MSIVLKDNVIYTEEVNVGQDTGGLGTLYFNALKKHGEKIAQTDSKTGKSDTYKHLFQKCVRTAIELQNRGVKKGDMIALCSNHHLNACVPFIATYFVGAITYCLDYKENVSETARLLKQVPPKMIFSIADTDNMLREAAKEAGVECEIVVFGKDFEKGFLGEKKNEESFRPVFVKDIMETGFICFSSGSTGLPKAICLSHYYMITNSTEHTKDPRRCNYITDGLVFLSYSGWYWGTSQLYLFSMTLLGGRRILCADPNPKELWYLIDKYKITNIAVTPFVCIEFCSTTRPQDVDTSSLRSLVTFGNSMAKQFFLQLRKMLPSAVVYQAYGMTEVGFCTDWNICNEKERKMVEEHPESIGLPLKGMTYRIVDPNTDATLSTNQIGELRIKTKQVMNGYYNRDCSDSFDKDGWFKCGDLMYYDENFLFYVVARLKDRIVYKDWWVYPTQLEEILQSHPNVKSAVVVGRPHITDFERPTAFVILKETSNDVTPEMLVKYVEGKVEHHYQRLTGGVVFVEKFPLLPTGKINKLKLKKMLMDDSFETIKESEH